MTVMTCIWGQAHPFISDFKAIKDRDNTLLTWTIRQGSICFGIGIWRSTDDINYELVGRIEGECGSIDKAKIYTWLDEKPSIPGKNYYKLEIGIEGTSEPGLLVTFADYGKNGLVISPNPFDEFTWIEFWNPTNDPHQIFVYTSSGQYIIKGKTTDDSFVIQIPEEFTSKPASSAVIMPEPLLIRVVNQKTKAVYTGKLLLIK